METRSHRAKASKATTASKDSKRPSQTRSRKPGGRTLGESHPVLQCANRYTILAGEQDDPPCPCKTCKNFVGQEKALKCSRCSAWLHLSCTDVTKATYDFLSRSDASVKWWCPFCEAEGINLSDPNDKIAQQSSKIDVLTEAVLSLQKQNLLILNILNREEKLEEKIKTQVSEIVVDQKEKEDRAKNLMMFNIPEPDSPSEEDDLAKVRDILDFVCPEICFPDVISKPTLHRLGSLKPPTKDDVSPPKPRPIKVVFKNSEVISGYMANAKKLTKYHKFAKIGIAPDKTIKERNNDRLVREELRSRQMAGEDVIIYKGGVKLKSQVMDAGSKCNLEAPASSGLATPAASPHRSQTPTPYVTQTPCLAPASTENQTSSNISMPISSHTPSRSPHSLPSDTLSTSNTSTSDDLPPGLKDYQSPQARHPPISKSSVLPPPLTYNPTLKTRAKILHDDSAPSTSLSVSPPLASNLYDVPQALSSPEPTNQTMLPLSNNAQNLSIPSVSLVVETQPSFTVSQDGGSQTSL